MSEHTFSRADAISAMIIKKAGVEDNRKLIILDTDRISAFTVQTLTNGEFSVTNTFDFPVEKDFYINVSERFLGDGTKSDRLFELCAAAENTLTRFLRGGGKEKDDVILDQTSALSCSKITDLYKSDYESLIKKALTEALKDNDGVPVYPIGRLAAFYPALHTIKEMLCEIPFLPMVPNLEADKDLFCGTEVFEAMGKDILIQAEKNKKTVKNNLLLVLKKITDNGLSDEFRLLAMEGDSFTKFSEPAFSEIIFADKNDSLVILSGGQYFNVRIPPEVFPASGSSCIISPALKFDGTKLMLSVKSDTLTADAVLDPTIYS